MSINDIIEGKKEWRARVARVKALPKDYQIVYKEIQKYLLKVGPMDLANGIEVLPGIITLFEEGVSAGKGVLEVTGKDVASFCDELIKDSKTYADMVQDKVNDEVTKAMKKALDKRRHKDEKGN